MKKSKTIKVKMQNTQIKRLLVACCILCASLGILFLVGRSEKIESSEPSVKSVFTDSMLLEENSGQAKEQTEAGENKLSKEFVEEVFPPSEINGFNVEATEDKKLIGFSLSMSSEDGFKAIKDKLTEKGWIYVESGNSNVASYKKSSAKLTWLLVSCQEVNKETEVVICVD